MFQIPLIDKLKALKDMIFSSPLLIILAIIFIIRITLMLIIKKRKKLAFLISFISIIITLSIISFSKFTIFLDYFVDVLFNIGYFPNFALYTILIITINIIMIYSIYKNENKLNNKITIIIYYSMMFLFILVINVITKENIDIHSKISIFGNNDLLSFIEISTFLFTIYLIYRLLYFILNKLLHIKNSDNLTQVTINMDINSINYYDQLINNINTTDISNNEINLAQYYETNQELINTLSNIVF